MSFWLRVIAFVLFILAALSALGTAHIQGGEAFIYWGLAAWVLSTLVGEAVVFASHRTTRTVQQ